MCLKLIPTLHTELPVLLLHFKKKRVPIKTPCNFSIFSYQELNFQLVSKHKTSSGIKPSFNLFSSSASLHHHPPLPELLVQSGLDNLDVFHRFPLCSATLPLPLSSPSHNSLSATSPTSPLSSLHLTKDRLEPLICLALEWSHQGGGGEPWAGEHHPPAHAGEPPQRGTLQTGLQMSLQSVMLSRAAITPKYEYGSAAICCFC